MELGIDNGTLELAANAACRAALRAGLSDDDARDLAQDALVRALTSVRPPAGVSLPAWVYGIAKNLGRDHAKSARRREVALDEAPETSHEEDVATVLAVRRALAELPLPLRDVITLHELEENSLRETADALQIPFDTAKDRLRRAREQLRARLADEAALATERSHTRRRAAASGAAIVAGVYALLRDPASAAAVTSRAAAAGAAAAAAGVRTVPIWLAAVAGSTLLVGGFALGRATAPSATPSAPPASRVVEPVAIEPDPDPVLEPETERASGSANETESSPASSTSRAEPARAASPRRLVTTAPIDAQPTRSPVPGGDEEQLLLDRARSGLRRGMYDEALVTLMEHARRYPGGDLAEERDVLIIEAYLRAGKPSLAQRRIERYRADHPAGVLRARVDALASELAQ